MQRVETLRVFNPDEAGRAKVLLATQVATMMGRKMEEGDWGAVYSRAKGIPEAGWSNLHIDINHGGLGVEHKLLRCAQLNGRPLKSMCGTTLMHPAATRSIRIDDATAPPQDVMRDVFRQYAELMEARREKVREKAPGKEPDMRVGWLLWENNLAEFLYFEERMTAPDPARYKASWNTTEARGARKESRSLWIYDRETSQKRFSVTTSAGIKIQPYFDVPGLDDANLCYFRVQSEPMEDGTMRLWIAASTAKGLERAIGDLSVDRLSDTILKLEAQGGHPEEITNPEADLAVPVPVTKEAHAALMTLFEHAVSDEHRAQLLLKALA